VTRDLDSGLTWITGTVHNTARDHRLRLVLPVPSPDSHSYAGAPFHIERRPVTINFDPDAYNERPLTDYPFVDYIRYGGVSVYSQCNGEYQITPRGIEITLCRCIGWLGRPDLAYRKGQAGPRYELPMAQLLNIDLPFAFIVAPSLADPAADYRRKELLGQTITQCVLVEKPPALRAFLPIHVDGAELCAVRRMDERRLELRLFNPRPEAASVRLQLRAPWRTIRPADLHGQPAGDELPRLQSDGITLSMRPFQILPLIAEM
jgi:alpha-mannosidase